MGVILDIRGVWGKTDVWEDKYFPSSLMLVGRMMTEDRFCTGQLADMNSLFLF